mgnify:FL=1
MFNSKYKINVKSTRKTEYPSLFACLHIKYITAPKKTNKKIATSILHIPPFFLIIEVIIHIKVQKPKVILKLTLNMYNLHYS